MEIEIEAKKRVTSIEIELQKEGEEELSFEWCRCFKALKLSVIMQVHNKSFQDC